MRQTTTAQQQPTEWPFDLHDAAERANRRGDYATAIELFIAAANVALTVGGRKVLIEKAKTAHQRANEVVH